jgi:hypothetical protein
VIISFAWTTPALLAGAKTMTRRTWTDEHAAKFHSGDLVDAWNQTPRVNSARRGIAIARKVATIRITRDPYLQDSREVRDEDYRREGFDWLVANGTPQERDRALKIWREWLDVHPRYSNLLHVVEFELVEVVR